MEAMSMHGAAMAVAWTPLCGQSWIGAAASFLGMWSAMMAAMMLPSLAPTLWRYHRAAGRAGEPRLAPLTALVGGGYLFIWVMLGAAVFASGAATMAATMRYPALARAVPGAIAAIVLAAGALQSSRWKVRILARCREGCCYESLACARTFRAKSLVAWLQGLRLGFHCAQCCAGLTAALIVTGMMDPPAMLAVTVAMTLERLAPEGERIARATGLVMIGGGLFLLLRAAGLGLRISVPS
jgi:predicted metal-binding membrane protein